MFDAPQYAEQFIELARKTLRCRDMHIRAKAVLVDAKSKPIINPKTKAPKVGFTEWPPSSDHDAAAQARLSALAKNMPGMEVAQVHCP